MRSQRRPGCDVQPAVCNICSTVTADFLQVGQRLVCSPNDVSVFTLQYSVGKLPLPEGFFFLVALSVTVQNVDDQIAGCLYNNLQTFV